MLASSPASAFPLWTVVGLVGVITVAVSVATAAALAESGRREVLARLGRSARHVLRGLPVLQASNDDLLLGTPTNAQARIAAAIAPFIPAAMLSEESRLRLARAGHFEASSAVLFAVARLIAPLVLPGLVMLALGDGATPVLLLVALIAGLVGPTAIIDRQAGARQLELASALPDALDLLVVCLEAGVGLDAALVRVARELEHTHVTLAAELGSVSRRIAAGLPRAEALEGLVVRTGLDEVRAVVSTIIQAERLGTSLARVLRMHSEGLRLRRRQLAEKRAAETSVKMMIPLVIFLLPAFFLIVLGPAALSIMQQFHTP